MVDSIEELRKQLEEEKKKIKDARERRKLKFQIAVTKDPIKRSIIGGLQAAGKGLLKTGAVLKAEGIRRQKIQQERLKPKTITKIVRDPVKRKKKKRRLKKVRKVVRVVRQAPQGQPSLNEQIFGGI